MTAYDVLLSDVLVGRLTYGDHGRVRFRTLPSYRKMARRPVLSQRFEDDLGHTYQGKRGRPPAFFANLVPEGRLREMLEDGAGVPAGDDLALLAAIGRDLPGAVWIRRRGDDSDDSDDSDEPAHPAAGDDRSDHDDDPGRLRFSLAGVQLKFSVLRQGTKLTLPARNEFGEWIAKLDSETYPGLVANEYSCLEWARAAGFDVPACHLHTTADALGPLRRYFPADARVLVIERYDRDGGRRIHQEDFCQVVGQPPRNKYDNVTSDELVRLAGAICGPDAVDEAIRRLVFAVACGNSDAHLKNWSLVYPDGITARLAPLYDQVATVAWPIVDREVALKLAGVKEFSAIDAAAFARLGGRVGMGRDRAASVVSDILARLAAAWRDIEGELPMSAAHRDALRDHWAGTPLVRGHLPG